MNEVVLLKQNLIAQSNKYRPKHEKVQDINVGLKIMQVDWFSFESEAIKWHNFESNSAEHRVDLIF